MSQWKTVRLGDVCEKCRTDLLCKIRGRKL